MERFSFIEYHSGRELASTVCDYAAALRYAVRLEMKYRVLVRVR